MPQWRERSAWHAPVRSGAAARTLVPPGPVRLRRGRFARGGRFVFRPWLGGRLELSGVFGGSQSFASSTATRSNSARISASFSSEVRRERSGRGMERLTHIPTLNARLLGGPPETLHPERRPVPQPTP